KNSVKQTIHLLSVGTELFVRIFNALIQVIAMELKDKAAAVNQRNRTAQVVVRTNEQLAGEAKVRRGALFGGDVPSGALDEPSDSTIELAAAVRFRRRGIETKLVLPGLAQQNQGARGNPALIKSI